MSLSRRSILGALTAAAGLGAATDAAAADDRVTTRGCDDAALEPGEWSTGAVTVRACPTADRATVDVEASGGVSFDRHPENPAWLRDSERVFVDPGQKVTVWFCGSITGLSCSNDDVNIGIANRRDVAELHTSETGGRDDE